MSPNILFYAFVEDAPSQAVLRKIVNSLNAPELPFFGFRDGHPKIMHGDSQIKSNFPACLEMANKNLYTFSFVDLDVYDHSCPSALIHTWLGIKPEEPIELPQQAILRVAVRTVESWIMADGKKFAKFFHLTESLLPNVPDEELKPRKLIFDLIQKKGQRKFMGMLPGKKSHIGPEYNNLMCDFVQRHWCPCRAEQKSPSLKRTMDRLRSMM